MANPALLFQPCCMSFFGLIVGIPLLYGGLSKYLLIQKINNTPTSKVRSAAVGLVELFGKAVPMEKAQSPISKADCVYWRVKGEYYRSGKHGGWRNMLDLMSAPDFFLEDETGKMLISPYGGKAPVLGEKFSGKEIAQVEIPADLVSTGHLTDKGFLGLLQRKKLDERVLAWLDANPNIKSQAERHGSMELRFAEYFIAEGDSVYVLGDAEPREGSSSQVAYENLVLKKGQNKIMFISDSREKRLVDSMRIPMYLFTAVGTVLTLGSILFILAFALIS